MSTRHWGPSHQEVEPPFERGPSLPWKLAGFLALGVLVHGVLDPHSNVFAWGLQALAVVWLAWLVLIALIDGRGARLWSLIVTRAPAAELVGEGAKRRRQAKRRELRSPVSAAAPTSE